MRINDAHLHLFLPDRVIDILQNSQYKNKYKLYNSINQSIILNPTNYVETIDDFFAIPIIFKEINIEEENKYVLETCDSLKKGIPVTLIDINENFKGNYNYLIFKEHFLLHKFDEWKNRSLYYEYLNEKEGFLILHCKDNIRLEYINELLKNFPKMNIIVAHLGRDIYEDSDVNVYDLTLLARYITSLETFTERQEEAADVNDDGKISALDYVRIKNYIMNGGK